MRRSAILVLLIATAGCSADDGGASPLSGSPGQSEGEASAQAQSDDAEGVACRGNSCRFLARPVAPLSTSRVTTHRPTLRWSLPDKAKGARVDLCLDRACDQRITTLEVQGDHVKLAEPLPSGVVYWRLRPLHGRPKLASATWEMFVGPETPNDTSLGSSFDFDGDGHADAVVASERDSKAFVFLGGPGGLSTTPALAFDPHRDQDLVVGNGGDINGDGFAEVLVRVGNRLMVLPGGTGAASSTPITTLDVPPTYILDRKSQASAGDFNGDGYGDVVVADRQHGQALVYFGGPDGLLATPGAVLAPPPGPRGAFGTTVDGAGDVNGDGLGDVVVSAPYAVEGAAKAFVFLGGSSGSPAASLLPPEYPPDPFDSGATAVGDVDGDGLGDAAVFFGWKVFVYLSQGGAFAGPPITLALSEGPSFAVPALIDGVGDMNGDGFDELAVGRQLFRGSPEGPRSPAWALLSSGAGGGCLASPGDVDGDGLSDLLLGDPNAPPGQGGSDLPPGRVFLFRGDPTEPPLSGQLRGEDYGVLLFGASVD